MYRLPTQFDAIASRQDLAAAGGGSTSTTCSSCIVTLLGSTALSAVVLGSLEPIAPTANINSTEPAGDDGAAGAVLIATEPTPAAERDSDLIATSPVVTTTAPSTALNKATRITLGIFALPLAAIGGLFLNFLGSMLGLFIALGLFVGIYAIVYQRSGRPLGRGIGVGIGMLVGLLVACAFEIMLWLGLMK